MENYTPIKIRILSQLNTVPCDIYLKLSSDNYVKIINQNDKFNREDIERYVSKKVDFLHIPNNSYQSFVNYCIDSMNKELLEVNNNNNNNNNNDPEKTIYLQMDAHEVLRNQLTTIGINPATIALSKNIVDSTIKMVESTSTLQELLKKTINKENNFIFEHSILLSYICCSMANNIDWQSENTKVKLSLSSLIHDITLEDHELAKISSISSPEFISLSSAKAKQFQNHPIEAQKLALQLKSFPAGIDQILIQHHELPNGEGFPRKLNAVTIPPLSAMFITAHTFIDYLYQSKFSEDAQEGALKKMSKTFLKGNFHKPFQSLAELFPK